MALVSIAATKDQEGRTLFCSSLNIIYVQILVITIKDAKISQLIAELVVGQVLVDATKKKNLDLLN
jgi:hypothetical protein